MTVSSMPCSARQTDLLHLPHYAPATHLPHRSGSVGWAQSFLRLCALLLLCSVATLRTAQAAEIEIRNAQVSVVEEGYAVAADFVFDLPPRLEEAIARGVVLYFVVDFELSRPRWYWLDETALRRNQTFRLSYHALTRQYRLASGALHQSFTSLDEAKRVLSRLRHWVVLEKGSSGTFFKPGENYLFGLRMRLDTSQLPRPFQLTALSSRDWSLSSDWLHWQGVPGQNLSAESR